HNHHHTPSPCIVTHTHKTTPLTLDFNRHNFTTVCSELLDRCTTRPLYTLRKTPTHHHQQFCKIFKKVFILFLCPCSLCQMCRTTAEPSEMVVTGTVLPLATRDSTH